MRQTVSTTEKSTWAKRLDRIGASPSLNNQEASGGREETGYIIVPKFGIPYDNKKKHNNFREYCFPIQSRRLR